MRWYLIAIIIIILIILYKRESFMDYEVKAVNTEKSYPNPFLPPFTIGGCKQPPNYVHDPEIMEKVPPSNPSSLLILTTQDNRLLTT